MSSGSIAPQTFKHILASNDIYYTSGGEKVPASELLTIIINETSERAMRVLPWLSGKIWVCAARPDHMTLLARLSL